MPGAVTVHFGGARHPMLSRQQKTRLLIATIAQLRFLGLGRMAKDERSNAILDRKLSILKRHDLLPLWKKLYLAAEAGCCRTVVQCLDDNPPPTISVSA